MNDPQHNNGEASQHEESSEPIVFVYTGQPVDEIPRSVTRVMVGPLVRRIEDKAFEHCQHLRTVTIPSTVKVIGDSAFRMCSSLTDVQFQEGLECSVETIGSGAFSFCLSLVDMTLPKQLKRIGGGAFRNCTQLSSVVLPPTIEYMGGEAFLGCTSLLCVEIPPAGSNLDIGRNCFGGATSLVNLSVSGSWSLYHLHVLVGCPFLSDEREFLRGRFSNHPVHSLCYNSSAVTREQMLRVLDDSSRKRLEDSTLKDAFQMTPFHILATSASLNAEILDCLLERYPMTMLGYKDWHEKTMMDYLLKHTSPRAVPLLQMVLKRAVVITVSTWHQQGDWTTNLSMLVESMPYNSDMGERRQYVKSFFGRVGYCCRIEITSTMELAAWKMKSMQGVQDSTNYNDGTGIDVRKSCRYQSGAGVVIENVFGYLWDGESTLDTGLSLFPLCSSFALDGRSIDLNEEG